MSWASGALPADQRANVVLVASTTTRAELWYRRLTNDPRWRVAGTANTVNEMRQQLAQAPTALVVDGLVFESASALCQQLASYSGQAVVLLPAASTEAEAALVRETPCVRQVFKDEAALSEALSALQLEALPPAPASAPAPAATPEPNPGGLRVITVWNLVGGAGKTTVATNLAMEARRRGLKTLLVGLGAPDDTAVTLPRLKAQPNLTHWEADATAAGLAAAVQSVEGLDVLAGYPNALALVNSENDGHSPLGELVLTAAYAGYGAIIFDAPALERAAPVLAAANQLVLVARPTLSDALRTVNAYRLVTEKFKGQHRLAPQAVRLVLNQARPGLWSARQFHEACMSLLPASQTFPLALAVLPDDGRLPETQNRRQLPLLHIPEFQQAFQPLADSCLPARSAPLPTSAPSVANPKTLFRLGPVKVKG